MSNVVRLADVRAARAPEAAQRLPDPKDAWHCMKCKGEAFRLLLNGGVRCAGCGAFVVNLEAVKR